MTSEQLEQKLRANPALRKANPHLAGQGVRSYTGPEEQHVQHRPERKPRVEAALCKTFRISVDLHFADFRTRDPDAALSTLLDCIIAARRQLEGLNRNQHQIEGGPTGG